MLNIRRNEYRDFLFRNYRCAYWHISHALVELKANATRDASHLFVYNCTYEIVIYREDVWKSKLVQAL